MSDKIKILTKLHAIMSEVGYIQKDKKNTHQNYNYASEKAIKEVFQPKLVDHKVILKVDCIRQEIDRSTTAKGGKSTLTLADFEYTFYDVESGESITGQFQGQGEDSLDKGIYKAITGAIKYILTSTFLTPTGDDPEENNPREKEPAMSDAGAVENYKIILKEFTDLKEYEKKSVSLYEDAIKNGVLKPDAQKMARQKLNELKNAK